MVIINKLKLYIETLKRFGLTGPLVKESPVNNSKVSKIEIKQLNDKVNENVLEFTSANPHSVELIACLYMIKILQEFKQEEQEKYNKVLGIINGLQTQREPRTGGDNARLNLANGMIYELSSNVSKLDAKIASYNNQMTLLKEYIKENMQLAKPKINLIIKK